MTDARTPSGASAPSDAEIAALDAHWRAANYLAVGQIYLMANPSWRSRWPPSTSSRDYSATGAPHPD